MFSFARTTKNICKSYNSLNEKYVDDPVFSALKIIFHFFRPLNSLFHMATLFQVSFNNPKTTFISKLTHSNSELKNVQKCGGNCGRNAVAMREKCGRNCGRNAGENAVENDGENAGENAGEKP